MKATMKAMRNHTSRTDMETCEEIKKSFRDHAKKHFGDRLPDFLPADHTCLQLGMYLGWVIETGLYSDYFEREASTEIVRFKRKKISCAVLSEIWNGYLAFEYQNKRGRSFTLFYYSSGLYRHDYEEVLSRPLPSGYHVEDTWPNYEKLKMRINSRYAEWIRLKKLLETISCEVEMVPRLRLAV